MARPEDLTETDRFWLCVAAGVPFDVTSDPENPGEIVMTTRHAVGLTFFRGGYAVHEEGCRLRVLNRDTGPR